MKPYSKIVAAAASVAMVATPALAAGGQTKPRMGSVMATAKASAQKSQVQPAQTNESGSGLRGRPAFPPGIVVALGVAAGAGLIVAIAAITENRQRSVSN